MSDFEQDLLLEEKITEDHIKHGLIKSAMASVGGLVMAIGSFGSSGESVRAQDTGSVQPDNPRCIDTTLQPGQVGMFNLTPVQANGPGYGVLYPRGAQVPDSSNVNFFPGSIIPNPAMTVAGVDTNQDGFGEVCYQNFLSGSEIIIDQQAGFEAPIISDQAERLIDTREEGTKYVEPFDKFSPVNGRQLTQKGKVAPGQTICVDTTGSQGDVGMFNLTPVQADGVGYITAFPQGDPVPETSNANFFKESIIPNPALIEVGMDTNNNGLGEICVSNSVHSSMEMIIDEQVLIDLDIVSSIPQRLADTRLESGLVQPDNPRCIDTTLQPGQVGMFNLTPVQANGPGYGVLYPRGAQVPDSSNVNFFPGSIIPNPAMTVAGVDTNQDGFGEVCYQNFLSGSEIIIDQQAGFEAPIISDQAERLIDTREEGTQSDGVEMISNDGSEYYVKPAQISSIKCYYQLQPDGKYYSWARIVIDKLQPFKDDFSSFSGINIVYNRQIKNGEEVGSASGSAGEDGVAVIEVAAGAVVSSVEEAKKLIATLDIYHHRTPGHLGNELGSLSTFSVSFMNCEEYVAP